MAKTKPTKKKQKTRTSLKMAVSRSSKMNDPSAESLLAEAARKLQQGNIEDAVPLAKRALSLLDVEAAEALPTLNLLGEIHIELGEIDEARQYFQQAAAIDENGTTSEEHGGGAEKFLWLAQISDEGGQDSVDWFEKGALSLRIQIQALLNDKAKLEERETAVAEKTRKLAVALCSIVEVYMTDLSWEEDIEQKCEALVTEATMVAPGFPEPWQTLANVRLSQERIDDAKAALTRSLDTWRNLSPEDPMVPDYPTRVSLARLLMEANMNMEAMEVLERLVAENDTSVEVWYLGGWGLYLMGEKQKSVAAETAAEEEDGEAWKVCWVSSRQWLSHSLLLFEKQNYEDERLGEHTKELLAKLDLYLGEEACSGDDEEDSDAWNSVDENDKDDEMVGV